MPWSHADATAVTDSYDQAMGTYAQIYVNVEGGLRAAENTVPKQPIWQETGLHAFISSLLSSS